MRIYEEYENQAEKKRCQSGAKRGKPTGKARGYVLVFNENGVTTSGTMDGIGSVFAVETGAGPGGLASCGPSFDYLRNCCRLVGLKHIPQEWQNAFKPYMI